MASRSSPENSLPLGSGIMSTQMIAGSPQEVRRQIRSNTWRGVTSGVAPGHVQANLAILPKELAFEIGRAHV